jgi:hypothetical protein
MVFKENQDLIIVLFLRAWLVIPLKANRTIAIRAGGIRKLI